MDNNHKGDPYNPANAADEERQIPWPKGSGVGNRFTSGGLGFGEWACAGLLSKMDFSSDADPLETALDKLALALLFQDAACVIGEKFDWVKVFERSNHKILLFHYTILNPTNWYHGRFLDPPGSRPEPNFDSETDVVIGAYVVAKWKLIVQDRQCGGYASCSTPLEQAFYVCEKAVGYHDALAPYLREHYRKPR